MQSLNQFERAGLWVTCQGNNRFLDTQVGIERLVNLIIQRQITDVFLQVFRSGRAWFPSNVFEKGAKDSKLCELLDLLGRQEVRAHAWVNVCNAGLSPSPDFIDLIGGHDAFLRDGNGRDTYSDLGIHEIDTPGLWLEPSSPGLHSTIKIISEELNQLSFSGVHLDFIRYPYVLPMKPASWIDCGIDFGYSELALRNFDNGGLRENIFSVSKINGLIPSCEKFGQLFDEWRRLQIENLILTFKQSLPADKSLSVAALAWSDRAYLNAHQDWRRWLEFNLIDSLCLMSYTADANLYSQQVKQAKAFLMPHQTLFAGIGLYKLETTLELNVQLEIAQRLEASPCFFCADRLLQQPFDR